MSRCVSLAVSPSSSAPRLARRFVAATLQDCSADDVIERAELLVSELVTNVIRHSSTAPRIVIVDEGACVRIEVLDTGSGGAVVREQGSTEVGGHGLLLVDAMADRWGASHDGREHVVWCEIAR